MRDEHGPDFLKLSGCVGYVVTQLNKNSVACDYFFKTKKHYQNYLRTKAKLYRERGKKFLQDEKVEIKREELIICTARFHAVDF